MSMEDSVYLILLIFSIAFGYAYRVVPTLYRKQVATFVGIAIIFVACGWHSVHQFITTAFTILLLQFGPKKYCHTISFLVLFSYILFFRICHWFGIPNSPSQSNAIQMMLTLKLVGICFEVHDTWENEGKLKKIDDESERTKLKLELKYDAIHPSALDVFNYAFCYIGVLTGPYYKYTVYQDAMKDNIRNKVDCIEATKKRIYVVPIYAALYLLASSIWPLSYATSTEIFRDRSFFYRIWYMTPTFFIFRMRIYSGFVLSECVCIMAGLGAYPTLTASRPGKGPTNYELREKLDNSKDVDYDFETIHNIDEWNSDFAPSVRSGMRAWNMTVQYWLVANVYKRLKYPKAFKETVTMLTSAFWHGVYPGYYLSMLTIPFIVAVEDYFEKKVRRNVGPKCQKVYDGIALFMKMQHFAYMGMAFLLLQIDTTLTYWRSIGFIYHGIIALQHAVAQFMNLILAKVDKKLKASRDTVYLSDYSKMKILKAKENIVKLNKNNSSSI